MCRICIRGLGGRVLPSCSPTSRRPAQLLRRESRHKGPAALTSSEKTKTRQPPPATVFGSAPGFGHCGRCASLRQFTIRRPLGSYSSTTSGSTQYAFLVFFETKVGAAPNGLDVRHVFPCCISALKFFFRRESRQGAAGHSRRPIYASRSILCAHDQRPYDGMSSRPELCWMP